VAQQSLAVSERLLQENRLRLEIGTTSRLDVVAAQSEVASRARDLTIAQTNLQMQEAALKNIFSKKVSPELDAARIVLKDAMPIPKDLDQPEFQEALSQAISRRPDLKQAETALENQAIAIKYTENSLLPTAGVFGLYAGAGLDGQGAGGDGGWGNSLWQTLKGTNPEYAGGASLSVSIKNRVAQADNLRAQLEGNQLKISMQRSRNQIAVEVRKAIIGLVQGKAQVQAAQEAVRLAKEIYDGERDRLDAGVSTSYQVILRERDLIAAQQAQVAAMVNYAKALVEMDRSIGRTLEQNGILLGDALSGTISRMPVRLSNSEVGSREVR
jgi:outer membrane protein TolC